MKLRTGWALALAVWGSLAVVASCGGRAHVDGTDSNTHWLKECDSDDQCGPLSCICGVCTAACEKTNDCARFGAKAACDMPAGCGMQGPTACVPSPSGGTGGSGGTTGGTSSGGTSSGGSPSSTPECEAMDARSSGDDCIDPLGYTWNGTRCELVNCGCTGTACGGLFETADACDHAHRECYAARGLNRECATHADCLLQDRRCCPTCGGGNPAAGDSLIATNITSPSPRDVGICEGDPQSGCDPCAPFEFVSAYPACIEGECRLLDVTPNAACNVQDECRLSTKDCCECGGDFSASGLIAVSSYARRDYCDPDEACPECEGGPPPENAQASCDMQLGLCRVGFIPK
jgi:hypothetical protein